MTEVNVPNTGLSPDELLENEIITELKSKGFITAEQETVLIGSLSNGKLKASDWKDIFSAKTNNEIAEDAV